MSAKASLPHPQRAPLEVAVKLAARVLSALLMLYSSKKMQCNWGPITEQCKCGFMLDILNAMRSHEE